MNMVQVSIGGKAVLVPVTTIGSLATGPGAVTTTLQPWRSFESGANDVLVQIRKDLPYSQVWVKVKSHTVNAAGRSGSQHGSLGMYESVTSPGMTTQSSQSSINSDEDDFRSSNYDSVSIQEAFTELIEAYDQCTPSSEQQLRAMNNLWSFYSAHADELEACAPELEALLCSKRISALEQSAPFTRVPTSPSNLPQRSSSTCKPLKSGCNARWNFLPRRSRSMS